MNFALVLFPLFLSAATIDFGPVLEGLSGLSVSANGNQVWAVANNGQPILGEKYSESSVPRSIRLHGVENNQWEAVVQDSQGLVWVLDTGDKSQNRKFLELFQFDPKDIENNTVWVRRNLSLEFPDGPHHITGGFILGDRMVLVENREGGFRFSWMDITSCAPIVQTPELHSVVAAEGIVKDAALGADGRALVLTDKGLFRVHGWKDGVGSKAVRLEIPLVLNPSAMALLGNRLLVGSQDGEVEVFHFELKN